MMFQLILNWAFINILPWIISLTLLQIPAAKSLKKPNKFTSSKTSSHMCIYWISSPLLIMSLLTSTEPRSSQQQRWPPPPPHCHGSRGSGEYCGGRSSSLGWWRPNYQASWTKQQQRLLNLMRTEVCLVIMSVQSGLMSNLFPLSLHIITSGWWLWPRDRCCGWLRTPFWQIRPHWESFPDVSRSVVSLSAHRDEENCCWKDK